MLHGLFGPIVLAAVVFGIIGGVSSLVLGVTGWDDRLSYTQQTATRLLLGGSCYIAVLVLKGNYAPEGALIAFLISAAFIVGMDYRNHLVQHS